MHDMGGKMYVGNFVIIVDGKSNKACRNHCKCCSRPKQASQSNQCQEETLAKLKVRYLWYNVKVRYVMWSIQCRLQFMLGRLAYHS